MKTWAECLYYMVRAKGGYGPPESDEYFEDALTHIKATGISGLPWRDIEMASLLDAAYRRGRLDEMDRAIGL